MKFSAVATMFAVSAVVYAQDGPVESITASIADGASSAIESVTEGASEATESVSLQIKFLILAVAD